MKKVIRKIFLYVILPRITLIVLDELIYIFPEPFFEHHKSYKQFEFYSSEKIPDNLVSILDKVDQRIRISEYYNPSDIHRIYYCPKGTAYHKIMFNINDRYVYNSTIRHNLLIFARAQFGGNKLLDENSKLEYKIDQCIAAIISKGLIDRSLPNWVKHGYQEYIRFYSEGYLDSSYAENVSAFLNQPASGCLINEQGISRPTSSHKSRILTEFLILVKGMKLDEIKSLNITEAEVLKKMMDWHASKQS